MIDAVIRAVGMALAMGWEILWPLILGFALSAVVQAAVSKQQMSRFLPDDRPRSIATALALGAASSSCSYATVALARSIFRKGAHFTAAMAFEMASTNLVLELGLKPSSTAPAFSHLSIIRRITPAVTRWSRNARRWEYGIESKYLRMSFCARSSLKRVHG